MKQLNYVGNNSYNKDIIDACSCLTKSSSRIPAIVLFYNDDKCKFNLYEGV